MLLFGVLKFDRVFLPLAKRPERLQLCMEFNTKVDRQTHIQSNMHHFLWPAHCSTNKQHDETGSFVKGEIKKYFLTAPDLRLV